MELPVESTGGGTDKIEPLRVHDAEPSKLSAALLGIGPGCSRARYPCAWQLATIEERYRSVSDDAPRVSDDTARVSDGTARVSDGTARVSDGTARVSDGTARVSDDEFRVSDRHRMCLTAFRMCLNLSITGAGGQGDKARITK
jgi:X-X-X-Leu-X-X-Gly heptad repeat protein